MDPPRPSCIVTSSTLMRQKWCSICSRCSANESRRKVDFRRRPPSPGPAPWLCSVTHSQEARNLKCRCLEAAWLAWSTRKKFTFWEREEGLLALCATTTALAAPAAIRAPASISLMVGAELDRGRRDSSSAGSPEAPGTAKNCLLFVACVSPGGQGTGASGEGGIVMFRTTSTST